MDLVAYSESTTDGYVFLPNSSVEVKNKFGVIKYSSSDFSEYILDAKLAEGAKSA